MINLLSSIYSKTSGSALSSDVGGRIYPDQYPQDLGPPVFPYVVFFIVSGVPEDCFAKDGETVIVQFSLFSASSGNVEIGTMYSDLKALFDDCSLTITSNNLVWCRRTNIVTMVDEITVQDASQMVRHWAVDYEITMQEA